jgi:hypothetical protein
LGAAAAVPAVFVAQAPPAAAAPSAEPATDPPVTGDGFCSTTMLTPEEIEQGRTSTVTCYPTFEESLEGVGLEPISEARALTMSDAQLNADGILAIHYDGPGGMGEPLTVRGSDCGGGGVIFEAGTPWNDRVRSTAPRGCSQIKHWTEPNYTGTVELVGGLPIGSLSPSLAGRVSSMRYWQ